MTNREPEHTRTDSGALINVESMESRNLELTQGSPGLEVVFADGWNAAESPQSAAGSPNPDVTIVSQGNPVSDEALKAPWFGVFEVRRAKSFLEILARIEQGAAALLLSVAALGLVILLVRSARQNADPKAGWTFAFALIFPATIVVFLMLRRLLYWRVDGEGIHQYCLGLRGWTLHWTEIVSRTLGPPDFRRRLELRQLEPPGRFHPGIFDRALEHRADGNRTVGRLSDLLYPWTELPVVGAVSQEREHDVDWLVYLSRAPEPVSHAAAPQCGC